MMTTQRVLLITTLLCAAASAACSPLGRGMQKVATNAHEEAVRMDHKVRDWFDSEDISGEQAEKAKDNKVTPAYCYKSLGQVSCYSRPIPGYEERFVGKQEPDPLWAENIYPAPDDKPTPPFVYVDSQTGETTVVETAAPGSVPADELPATDAPRELIPVFGK